MSSDELANGVDVDSSDGSTMWANVDGAGGWNIVAQDGLVELSLKRRSNTV
jgi:hypothetical protein